MICRRTGCAWCEVTRHGSSAPRAAIRWRHQRKRSARLWPGQNPVGRRVRRYLRASGSGKPSPPGRGRAGAVGAPGSAQRDLCRWGKTISAGKTMTLVEAPPGVLGVTFRARCVKWHPQQITSDYDFARGDPAPSQDIHAIALGLSALAAIGAFPAWLGVCNRRLRPPGKLRRLRS